MLRGDPTARDQIVRALARLETVRRDVAAGEPRSLFNPAKREALQLAPVKAGAGG